MDDYFAWLHRAVPAVAADLRPPATESQLDDFAAHAGVTLTDQVRALFLRHDGQPEDPQVGAVYGLEFLSLDLLRRHWDDWAGVREEAGDNSYEWYDQYEEILTEGHIQQAYSTPGWVPLFRFPGGHDYLGVDLNPGPAGAVGQVINFGRDENEKYVAAADLDGFFALLLEWAAADVRAKELFGSGARLFNRLHDRATG